MKEQNKQIKKVCGFHVNDWHLTTMILPYVHKEIEKENQIITILQNGMKTNIEEILQKMNLNKDLNEKIKQIDWTKTYPVKLEKIKNKLEKAIEKLNNLKVQADNINILVNGDREFIEIVNKNIEKFVKNINIEGKITIINCYNVTRINKHK